MLYRPIRKPEEPLKNKPDTTANEYYLNFLCYYFCSASYLDCICRADKKKFNKILIDNSFGWFYFSSYFVENKYGLWGQTNN